MLSGSTCVTEPTLKHRRSKAKQASTSNLHALRCRSRQLKAVAMAG